LSLVVLKIARLEEAHLRGTVEGWTDRAITAGRESIAGKRRGFRALFPFAGPAVVASVAYMDPGNFATNIESGAKYGYLLLWVVVLANLVAMLFQSLSARLGIVTGKSLAEQCRDHFPRPVVWAMWGASEVAAMATDLAEFLGAAIGLSLLFGLPLMVSLGVVGVATYAVLQLQGYGFRPMELVIAGFVAVIGASYFIELVIAPPDWKAFAWHSVAPALAGPHSLMIAVGIVGATVMPHAIYLHSSLTKDRVPVHNDDERRRVLRFSNVEVLVALGLAGLVNMAMTAMAAAAFHPEHGDVATIETAYRTLIPLLGGAAATVFLTSLLASGFSSSVVGTMAGQVIMQDFIRFTIPLWARRLITMIPAFVVVGFGADATQALVLSQVVLSLVLPVPLIALILLTSRRDVMGDFVSGIFMRGVAGLAASVVAALNLYLLAQAAGLAAS
jgi:manganese transport protein